MQPETLYHSLRFEKVRSLCGIITFIVNLSKNLIAEISNCRKLEIYSCFYLSLIFTFHGILYLNEVLEKTLAGNRETWAEETEFCLRINNGFYIGQSSGSSSENDRGNKGCRAQHI